MSHFTKKNSRAESQTVGQLTAQYDVDPNTSVSDTVGYGTAQQNPHSWTSIDQASLSTTPRVGSETLRLDYK
ncbi:hypothetical protein TNCV_4824281 [Trichonephila clavipes]|nr:hypothetical protein TNCV_4824281 [Trichonephila clavipes]